MNDLFDSHCQLDDPECSRDGSSATLVEMGRRQPPVRPFSSRNWERQVQDSPGNRSVGRMYDDHLLVVTVDWDKTWKIRDQTNNLSLMAITQECAHPWGWKYSEDNQPDLRSLPVYRSTVFHDPTSNNASLFLTTPLVPKGSERFPNVPHILVGSYMVQDGHGIGVESFPEPGGSSTPKTFRALFGATEQPQLSKFIPEKFGPLAIVVLARKYAIWNEDEDYDFREPSRLMNLPDNDASEPQSMPGIHSNVSNSSTNAWP